jgi:1,2-diacylglycerol 3-alpha-glucosyltransferase
VGLSAVQAMAYGVPMLVSRNEPHSPEIEACLEGETADFFETNNADALAEKLFEFLRPDSHWFQRRASIADFIARNYTFEGMVEAFATAVQQIGAARGLQGCSAGPKIAFVWAQFGPYHFARLHALQERLGKDRIVGIEIANKTVTYDWERGSAAKDGLLTLVPDEIVEECSAITIYWAAYREFRRQGVGVAFIPSYWPASSFAVLMAALTAGIKIVMMNDSHAHTAKARGLLAKLKRSLVLRFDAAFVAGGPHKDYFISLGMKPEKITTGYDAVDNDLFAECSQAARANSHDLRQQYGLPNRYFLNVGRMVRKKNLETLVDAYREVRQRVGADCPRLVFAGSGPLEKALQDRCVSAGLSVYKSTSKGPMARHGDADVFFLGFRQSQELPAIYALASAFILPSKEEEWGLVVNEAMACGLPVLVSRVAGCARDLVKEQENGYLFDPFDVEALADGLENIARQPALTETMGAASRKIIANWGCDRFARAAQEATAQALQSR